MDAEERGFLPMEMKLPRMDDMMNNAAMAMLMVKRIEPMMIRTAVMSFPVMFSRAASRPVALPASSRRPCLSKRRTVMVSMEIFFVPSGVSISP